MEGSCSRPQLTILNFFLLSFLRQKRYPQKPRGPAPAGQVPADRNDFHFALETSQARVKSGLQPGAALDRASARGRLCCG